MEYRKQEARSRYDRGPPVFWFIKAEILFTDESYRINSM